MRCSFWVAELEVCEPNCGVRVADRSAGTCCSVTDFDLPSKGCCILAVDEIPKKGWRVAKIPKKGWKPEDQSPLGEEIESRISSFDQQSKRSINFYAFTLSGKDHLTSAGCIKSFLRLSCLVSTIVDPFDDAISADPGTPFPTTSNEV